MLGTKGIHQSYSTEFKKGHTRPKEWIDAHKRKISGDLNPSKRPEVREKLRLAFSGSKSHFYKDGRSKDSYRIRRSRRTKLFREYVFKRDNYTCQKCGKRGGKLHVHHIKSFATHPELRFDVKNGQILCIPCHKQTYTYAKNLK